LRKSAGWLASDLRRQGGGIVYEDNAGFTFPGGVTLTLPILAMRPDGKQFAIALSGPITTGHPADESLLPLIKAKGAPELIVVNELLVRGNLPAATREVFQRLKL
jgi:hypothetical protein